MTKLCNKFSVTYFVKCGCKTGLSKLLNSSTHFFLNLNFVEGTQNAEKKMRKIPNAKNEVTSCLFVQRNHVFLSRMKIVSQGKCSWNAIPHLSGAWASVTHIMHTIFVLQNTNLCIPFSEKVRLIASSFYTAGLLNSLSLGDLCLSCLELGKRLLALM